MNDWSIRIPNLRTLLASSIGRPKNEEFPQPEARPKPDTFMSGTGRYEFVVVGESNHQAALEHIVGGRTCDSARYRCVAVLVPEPDNPYDPQAVCVSVDGYKVGHLPRDWAPKFKTALATNGYKQAACNALIVGGWDRGKRDRGHFGIKLDIVLPFDFHPTTQAMPV